MTVRMRYFGTPELGDTLAWSAQGFVPTTPAFRHLGYRGLATGASNAAANALLIQEQIDATNAGTVWVPPGTYYYDTTLKPKTAVALVAAVRGATTLVYTGAGNGVEATLAGRPSGVYRARIEGITFQFGGGGSGHGFFGEVWRYGEMRDCHFTLFPGSGVYLDGNAAGTKGCWTNRFSFVECDYNGSHGWYVGENGNAVVLSGCIGSLNGRDGMQFEKNARATLFGCQTEANARHAVAVMGAQDVGIFGHYVEHQDPATLGLSGSIPAFATQSPRYCLYVTQSVDAATLTKSVVVEGGHWEGADNGGTTTTNAVVYADNCHALSFNPGYAANARSNRAIQVQSTVRRWYHLGRMQAGGADDTVANSAAFLNFNYDYAQGGNSADRRGLVGVTEGFANLLVNGGFDADLLAATTVPQGWTQVDTATYAYEAGTDGGNRLILTNSTTHQSGISQDVSGPEVGFLVANGVGTVAFWVIAPTTNTRNKCQVRVRCLTSGGGTVSGGGLESWFLTPSNTETRYVLPFPVPATTAKVRVYVFASDGGASNSDVLKVDRIALWAGEVPKFWAPRPLSEAGGRLMAGLQLPTKAGAFSDADFPVAPANGSLVGLDTTNNRVYVKDGAGVYRYAGLT